MNQSQPNNPLHGVTLKTMLEYLVAEYGWERLGQRINIHCFNFEPSINSSLKFLRKTDWARAKVGPLVGRLSAVRDRQCRAIRLRDSVAGKSGFRFQASVGVTPTRYERVRAGETVEVNGAAVTRGRWDVLQVPKRQLR